MTTTAAAIYEHGVLRPLAPLPLAEGARVEVTVTHETSPAQAVDGRSANELLRELAALPMESGDSGFSAAGRTGAELARLWPMLPHLTEDDATAFERDLAVDRATSGGQAAPAWE